MDPTSRWKEAYSGVKPSLAIYNLVEAHNARARLIADAVDSEDIDVARRHSASKQSPINEINELLRLSNIKLTLKLNESDEIIASREKGLPYSVAELSDGERNALLLASDVLTAPRGSLLLIDEPERHLHRSIASPLLSQLFRKRADCCFVLSTHELTLCEDSPNAKVLIIRSCEYYGKEVSYWDIDLLADQNDLPGGLKLNILGSRRKLIFVEGTRGSLDEPLYNLLFPSASIIPKENCRHVEDAVNGIRQFTGFHHLRAWGILDNDRRPLEDLERLRKQGLFSLHVYSVESIFYNPEIVKRVARRFAEMSGRNKEQLFEAAKSAAIKGIKEKREHLISRAIEKEIRRQAIQQFPKTAQITSTKKMEIVVDIESEFEVEATVFDKAINGENLQDLIGRYPVRETPALAGIAKAIGFQDRTQYEEAVLKLLADDQEALGLVRTWFIDLIQELEVE